MASRLLVLVAFLALGAEQVQAQAPVVLRGVVVDDSTGTPLTGAQVVLNGGAQLATSDDKGEFMIAGLAAGEQVITIRLLGFSPLTTAVSITAADSSIIEFALPRNVPRLSATEIVGQRDLLERGKLSEFHRRKELGIGTFLSAELFTDARSTRVSEILRSRLPGSRIVNSRCSSRAFVATTRGSGSIQDRLYVMDCDKLLDRSCPAAVYLDGVNVYRGMTGEPLFDVNSVNPSDISAVEFYAGTAQLPPEYRATSRTCAVLVIWTK